jgi:ribonucleotide reductase alpha subunit
MSKFKDLQTEYNELIKSSNTEFNRIVKEDLPMDSGFAYTVKNYPMPTIEQAEKAKQAIDDLRGTASRKREELQKLRNEEVEEKIKQLGELIGTKDYSKKKTTDAKWVIEARSHSTLTGATTTPSFWRDTHQSINAIAKWILERKEIENKKKISENKTAEKLWCKQYIIDNLSLDQILLNNMSEQSIIELAHAHLKREFSKANELTSEKCYCDAHNESRHYHFAETYWNGTEVQVYESSETY